MWMRFANALRSSAQGPRERCASIQQSLSPQCLPGIGKDERFRICRAADEPAKVAAKFWSLDGDILNEAIPAFFIGRNMEGFWVARDARGRIGGIFLLKNSALSFARRNSHPAGCATIFPSERFELDLENRGNPLVAQLGRLKRLAIRGRARMVAFIGNMGEAAKVD